MAALRLDAAVVGGGVVGLAVAAALARRRPRWRVGLLERHGGPGRETSSRNSGVVHAGLHGAPGSLKRRLCVEGRERLYRFCAARGVPHAVTGKLVLAAEPGELEALGALAEAAEAAGAGPLQWWEGRVLRRREPALRGVAALHVVRSGLVDAHGFAAALAAEADAAGAVLGWGHALRAMEPMADGRWRLHAEVAGEPVALEAERVVGCAGLEADRLAAMAGLDPRRLGCAQRPWAGRWFRLEGAGPLPTVPLVYPLPPRRGAGLGLHLTRTLQGRWLLGPDAEDLGGDWAEVAGRAYRVPESLRPRFEAGLRRLLRQTGGLRLVPEGAGVRPRLLEAPPGGRDFLVLGPERHGRHGYVHLAGIESPGLTAALALGEHVARLLDG